MQINPKEQKALQNYLCLMGAIVPRPIAWVSTRGLSGATNLAPFSFFTCVCVDPPMVSLTISRRGKEEKDTLRNIRDTREFVVNVVPEWLGEKMVSSATALSYGKSEMEALGLTPAPSDLIQAPRLAESPIHMECRLHDILLFGPKRHTFVIGEVVMFHMDKAILTHGLPDMAKLRPIGRLNFDLYCRSSDLYEMVMTDHFSQDQDQARKVIPKAMSV